jgi:hypothetical protein
MVLILMIGFPVMLAAQQNNNDPAEPADPQTDNWEYSFQLYSSGDKIFTISLGVVFPTVFINNGDFIDHNFNPPVGGTGLLAYYYYLNSWLFVGGELSGFFINTLRRNTLYIIPLGLTAGVQLVTGRFEFPFFMTIGMSWHTYLDQSHYGLYMKAGTAAYFRATSDWSFGIAVDWSWFPQRTENPSHNVDGNFLGLRLSARYHF